MVLGVVVVVVIVVDVVVCVVCSFVVLRCLMFLVYCCSFVA